MSGGIIDLRKIPLEIKIGRAVLTELSEDSDPKIEVTDLKSIKPTPSQSTNVCKGAR